MRRRKCACWQAKFMGLSLIGGATLGERESCRSTRMAKTSFSGKVLNAFVTAVTTEAGNEDEISSSLQELRVRGAAMYLHRRGPGSCVRGSYIYPQENENLARHLHIEGASDANGIDRRALGPAASSATGTEYGRHFVLPSCNRSVQPLRLSQRAFLVPAGSDVRIQSSLTGIWFTAQDSTSRRPATRPKLQTRFASTTRHWPALKLTLRSGTSSEDGRRCPFQQELS